MISPMPITTKRVDSTDRRYITPYWIVETTPDPGQANMEHSTMAATVVSKCKDAGEKIVMQVPVLQNTKMLNPGDELLLHKPALKQTQDDGHRPAPPPPKRCNKGRGRGRGGPR